MEAVLLDDDVILSMSDPQNSNRKLPELMNGFSITNISKSVPFLPTRTNTPGKKSRKQPHLP